jgi:hypothetical protein
MKVLFLFPLVFLIVSCAPTQFLTNKDRSIYPIALNPKHTVKYSAELFAGDKYLRALPDSVVTNELTNAMGYFLQQLGYPVFTLSADTKGLPAAFTVKSSRVEFKEINTKEFIEQITCHDTLSRAIRLDGLQFSLNVLLIPMDSINEAQVVATSDYKVEEYSDGELSKETSLLGMLVGIENDKTAFNGEIYDLNAQDLSHQLIYNCAKMLADNIHEKISYYHYHNKTFKKKRGQTSKPTGTVDKPKQNIGLKK